MATYKVLQDIEAEDKLVGPLTLHQFIYAAVAAVSLYISFLSLTKGAAFIMVVFLPIAFVAGFFAFPWKGEQPTEIWALAKIRFMVKPRKRIWDQTGMKELVTVTAPKKVEHQYTNNLSEIEVKSRLKALADTIDSRGWATKNADYNVYNKPNPLVVPGSDRLVAENGMPQEVATLQAPPTSEDMFDDQSTVATQLDAMLSKSTKDHHARVLQEVSNAQQAQAQVAQPQTQQAQSGQPSIVPNNYWFLNDSNPASAHQAPQVVLPGTDDATAHPANAADPTEEEKALAEHFKHQNQAAQQVSYGHLHVIQPLSAQNGPAPQDNNIIDYGQVQAQTQQAQNDLSAEEQKLSAEAKQQAKPAVTRQPDPAILELANNDDLDVATIARQANKEIRKSPDEVEIRLH